MDSLFSFSADKKQEVLLRLFYLFTFFIPLSSYINVRLLVFAFFFSFFVWGSRKTIFLQGWDIIFYLAVLTIGLIYSKDISTGLRVLETNFSFLAIPFIFSHFSGSQEEITKRICRFFALGLLVASLICLSFALFRYLDTEEIKYLFFDNFTEPIYSHPTYFAYYLIFSISVELYFLYYHQESAYGWRYLTILFLFFILILTGGQTAFISLLFVFSFFILKFFTEEVNHQKRVVAGLVVLMLSCMFLISIVEKGNRALELNDSWERAILWESAISANAAPFFGVGTGDYKVVLNDYYTTHNLEQFASESYNAHNQWIQLLFSNGVFGVLAFCIMIGRPLYLAMRNKNILAILCMFPFLIYGITEVFFGRYQGVVFFALLHQVFMMDMKSEMPRLKLSRSVQRA